ncbi:MAG: serine/threonine protein kinase [Desulfobulbaceae bacterium]|nr:serine/threonine protein kinase [Desulfobulbaceae bacterium]
MGDLKKLGKYEIQSVLGKGAMGIVYKGIDPGIERTVAIKAIRKDAFSPAEMESILERFKREAQAAGRLHHPGIVTVFEYAEEGDDAFIAMEYAKGRELQDFLDNNEKFPINTAVDIVTQLLDVLIYSHARGVIHRDIKPANILLVGDGQIKVMDYGIAKIESSTLTQFGDVFGTPSYMSPEQFAGQPVDKRTDLYSAGILLYHMLTGEKPFQGDSVTNIMHQIMTTEAPVASEVNLKVPASLDKVIRKALAKKQEKRYQTAEEFKADLTKKFLVDETLSADLSGKTNDELKAMCATAGITGCSKKNKKQLIGALQDAGDDTSAILKMNLTSGGMATSKHADDPTVAVHADQQGEYDETVFEPKESQEGGSKEVKRTPFRKKLKRALAILLVTILAIFSFTGWKIYKKDLTFQEVKQLVIKAKDDPASVADQFVTIVIDKSKDLSISLYEQLITIAKEKWEDIQTSSPDQNTTIAKEKSEDIPDPPPKN